MSSPFTLAKFSVNGTPQAIASWYRRSQAFTVRVVNIASADLWIGPDSSVTSATGLLVPGHSTFTMDVPAGTPPVDGSDELTQEHIYAVAPGGADCQVFIPPLAPPSF